MSTATAEHEHDSHGHHDPDVPHQFENMEQKNECDKLGMWTFLATEVLFFGGLFAALSVYRFLHFEAFHEASEHLIMPLGFLNTAVLLFSSLTVALSVRAAAHAQNKALILNLILTMLLGFMFLGVKAIEYTVDFHDHLVPGWYNFGVKPEAMDEYNLGLQTHDQGMIEQAWFDSGWEGVKNPDGSFVPYGQASELLHNAQLYFCFYFTMTAIHATHMVVGLGIFAVLIYRAKLGQYTPRKHAQVEITGLYWHFVDIVWIFLFPLLYLIK